MKILYSGGGTLGPVTPLLAMHSMFRKQYPDMQALWIGTAHGPEFELVIKHDIPFRSISSGKFRRYISIWNIVDIIRIFAGFFQAFALLLKERPSICISAGGFNSVPIHWAAWFLRIPTWIHQQDVDVGLANKLMAPIARVITTALEDHVGYLPKKKRVWTGNPVREEILQGSKEEAKQLFNLQEGLPVVFVTGGGTGSQKVNQMLVEALPDLEGHCQIIHLTGRNRPGELASRAATSFSFYQTYPFFTSEMKHAYAAADIVVSRGGIGTLSEVASLSKAAILIPHPGHQYDNVRYLSNKHAAIFLDERTSDGKQLAKYILHLLRNPHERELLGQHIVKTLPRAAAVDIQSLLREHAQV